MRTSITTKRMALASAATLSVALTIPLALGSSASAGTSAAAQRVPTLLGGTSHARQFRFSGTRTFLIYLRGSSALPTVTSRRISAARVAQRPVTDQLASVGATNVVPLSTVDAVVATLTSAQATALASSPRVQKLVPNETVPGPATESADASNAAASKLAPSVTKASCGSAASPELDPEALANIHATPAENGGINGAGVSVAYLADGINTTNPDFKRNAAYASTGSPAGQAVVSQKDFSGDSAATPTAGGEAFIDAGSIVAQGNSTYDLSKYTIPGTLPKGCDIKIVGAAPGAHVLGLKVFSADNATTTANFIEAINYAVNHGVKVINESFGGGPFPGTAQDSVIDANDAAIAQGVTVVVSTGDAGITNTIGSPAVDPKVIAVGGSTTFREYEQEGAGGTNVPGANGEFVDNNVSALSSAGYDQASGRTVDLLAPGDLNWGLCSPSAAYTDCVDNNGKASDLEVAGGTSESSPFTAAAAADVIQAYASTHGGKDPAPAVVKRVIMSTTTDVGAPASQGGAGLLDVHAAELEAESLPGTTGTSTPGLLINPGAVVVQQRPGTTTSKKLAIRNTGSAVETVHLSTRSLTKALASHSGSFCLQPGKATKACPANTGTFVRESGFTQTYQAVPFTVPASTSSAGSRLVFTADYPNTGQDSVLKLALLEPDGTYAGYSQPQGQADFADVEVADPPAGTWTAVFFTSKDDASADLIGTRGTIRWNASTLGYAPASAVSPRTLTISPGHTGTATLRLRAATAAGDQSESVVITGAGNTTTVPVTQRTLIPITAGVGKFKGVLTGGNGRDGVAQTNSYEFNVPRKTSTLRAVVALHYDRGDTMFAALEDPHGQTVALNSNVTDDGFGHAVSTIGVDLYATTPEAGRWHLVVAFADPTTGAELKEPFVGAIHLNQNGVSSNLPKRATTTLKRGRSATFAVNVANHGGTPEAYFLDPRLAKSRTIGLLNFQFTPSNKVPLPLAGDYSTEPTFFVPPETTKLIGHVTGTAPVTFDMYPADGDPSVSASVKGPGSTRSISGNNATATLTEREITPGLWFIDPSELGPYGAAGAPAASAKVSLRATTPMFDSAISSSTGDFWEATQGLGGAFAPQYVPRGDSTSITVHIKPTAKVGSVVHGTVYVDALTLASPFTSSSNEVIGIPYTYRVR